MRWIERFLVAGGIVHARADFVKFYKEAGWPNIVMHNLMTGIRSEKSVIFR